ncbi:MAG: endonuclease MutS2 [Acidobacteriota bacterium]
MESQAFTALEFEEFRKLLSRYAQTPLGRQRLLSLLPINDAALIAHAHQEVSECAAYQREFGHIRISEIEDPTEVLIRLAVANTRLSPDEMLQLQNIINIGSALRQQLREVRERMHALAAIEQEMPNLSALYNRLRTTLLPSGEINEDASPELRRLRRDINALRARIYRQLETLIDQAGSEGAVRDEFVTVRNGRFVIPVRNDSRGRVPGVVHGLSSSGATAFVEPLSTIDDNNELMRLKELEEAEIAKVLFALTEELRKELPGLKRLVGALTTLDIAVAKANFAEDYDGVAPEMNAVGRLELVDARHPLLEHNLRGSGARVVPISFTLDSQRSAMIISGPNAGGKTVVLKTVGLLALMAQSGLHIPARRASLPIFKQVLADIGDHQSIAANLSTFSSHISNISDMAANVALPALVLIDEVGTGTDPEEGAALGVAIVDYFKCLGAMVLVSTHYNPLKHYASQTPGVVNASVEFDELTLRPTYRLLIDVAGTSSGIEIARRLGLQEEILQLATKTLDRRDLHQANFLKTIKAEAERWQELTAALEDERQATAAKYQQLEAEFAAREQQRQRDFERQMEAAIDAFNTQATQFISQLKDRALAAKLTKEREKRVFQLKRQARETLPPLASANAEVTALPVEPAPAPTAALFSVGDRVQTELGQQGAIEEIQGEDIFVRVGVMRFKTRAENLRLLTRADTKQTSIKLPSGVHFVSQETDNVASELNVIGCLAEEACERVDKFLDQAFLASYDRVRIVHGTGMGKLRRAISELLQAHPHVAKFYQAAAAEGGTGATIVELRQ